MTSETDARLSEALRDIVGAQPFEPDLGDIERRGRRLRRRARTTRGIAGLGVAALLAAAFSTVPGTTRPGRTNGHLAVGMHAPAAKPRGPLVRLADYIVANDRQPAGNATLVIRTQSYPNAPAYTGVDLYTDSGEYFWAPNESGLPAEIAANDDIGGGMFAREVAAATYAVNGSLAVAREKMEDAPFASPGASSSGHSGSSAAEIAAPGDVPKVVPIKWRDGAPVIANPDNYIWEDSMDALIAGAANPLVRAGVLRLLSTLSEVSVTKGTIGGQPVLTLTATAPALPANYQEALTISADSGIPILFTGGTPGQTPGVTTTFQVSRVTLSNIAAGRF